MWGLLSGAVINLFLPFVNGLMLGFGELVANEAAFRLGWSGTKVCFSTSVAKWPWVLDAGEDAFVFVCCS